MNLPNFHESSPAKSSHFTGSWCMVVNNRGVKYLWIRILFFLDTPFAHTHLVNPTCESGNFWIHSPEWKLLNLIFFRIRVDGQIQILFNPMTLQEWVQSLQSSWPCGYKTTWRPTKTFLLFLLGWDLLTRFPICILVCLWSFIFYTHF